MKLMLKYKNILAFLSGGISVLGFAPFFGVWALFFAFSFLMYFLLKCERKKELFLLGYSFGFAHFAFGLIWVGNALLIEPEKFGWLYPVVFFASGAFFGVFFALPAMFTSFAQKTWQKWVVFVALTVVFEWLRSFFLTGFPWNLLGYSLAFSDEMVQAASVGGVYLLSLIALFNYTLIGFLLFEKNKKKALILLSVFVVCNSIVWGSGYLRLKNSDNEKNGTILRIVQPSIPQVMKWKKGEVEKNFKRHIELSGANAARNPDIIVWGETASPYSLDIDKEKMKDLLPILKKGSYLVAGMVTYAWRKNTFLPHNSMVVFDSNGEVVDYYHKSHLVPFGEYIPLRKYLPEVIRPIANAIGNFGKGGGPKIIRLEGLPSFGGIICYEVIFAGEVVDRKNRPDFLINVTNDAWYGESAGPYQHWVTAKLRAIEEGIEVVRVANNGISGLISAYGKEEYVLPLNYSGFVDVELCKPLKGLTWYARFGNLTVLMFCLILIYLGFIKFKAKVKS